MGKLAHPSLNSNLITERRIRAFGFLLMTCNNETSETGEVLRKPKTLAGNASAYFRLSKHKTPLFHFYSLYCTKYNSKLLCKMQTPYAKNTTFLNLFIAMKFDRY